MRLTHINNAVSEIMSSNKTFAVETETIRGINYPVFKNAPQNLCEMLKRSFSSHDDGKAEYLVYQNERWSYDAFCADIKKVAWHLQKEFSVKKGTPVAIAMRNYPEFIILVMAISALGAKVVFLNAWWTTKELKYALEDSSAKLVFADGPRTNSIEPLVKDLNLQIIAVRDAEAFWPTRFSDFLKSTTVAKWPEANIEPEDDFSIMYSSGTTGHPKGIILTHRGAINAVYTWLMQPAIAQIIDPPENLQNSSSVKPSVLVVTPLFHVTATHPMFLLSLAAGAKICLMHKWDAEVAVRIIRDEKVTRFLGVPTQSAELMAAAHSMAEPLDTLDFLGSGGAKRPATQVAELHKAFPSTQLATGWGMTETNAVGIGLIGDEYLDHPGAAGRLQPPLQEIKFLSENGQEVSPGEVGEITVKSVCNMRGYLNQPDATKDVLTDGWLKTGDLGMIDADGIITIVDRKKNIVIRGGENIACLDVEGALHRHPSVLEACVFSLPDDRLGEIVGAGVQIQKENTVTTKELQDFLLQHIAHFKIPQHIWLQIEPLPRGATDKIDRRGLQQRCLSDLQAQSETNDGREY
ncbi:MAG: acyl--CoA ligase [Marinovum sp.]|nr:acyl--CoA ligase [Marinovum sp.]MBT6532403.1 acyl--CoA ligase [Marinovum sp.]